MGIKIYLANLMIGAGESTHVLRGGWRPISSYKL